MTLWDVYGNDKFNLVKSVEKQFRWCRYYPVLHYVHNLSPEDAVHDALLPARSHWRLVNMKDDISYHWAYLHSKFNWKYIVPDKYDCIELIDKLLLHVR